MYSNIPVKVAGKNVLIMEQSKKISVCSKGIMEFGFQLGDPHEIS